MDRRLSIEKMERFYLTSYTNLPRDGVTSQSFERIRGPEKETDADDESSVILAKRNARSVRRKSKSKSPAANRRETFNKSRIRAAFLNSVMNFSRSASAVASEDPSGSDLDCKTSCTQTSCTEVLSKEEFVHKLDLISRGLDSDPAEKSQGDSNMQEKVKNQTQNIANEGGDMPSKILNADFGNVVTLNPVSKTNLKAKTKKTATSLPIKRVSSRRGPTSSAKSAICKLAVFGLVIVLMFGILKNN